MGNGRPAQLYLGRYHHRGVIRESDILACYNDTVRFRFRNANSGRPEQRTLPEPDFLWLILKHVLPKGFRRARHFGFLHPNCKGLIALLHVLLRFDAGAAAPASPAPDDPVCLLRRSDDDRANVDSIGRIGTRKGSDSQWRNAPIV